MLFLANRASSVIGLELLAIMYSLPYALAMWSYAHFSVADSSPQVIPVLQDLSFLRGLCNHVLVI